MFRSLMIAATAACLTAGAAQAQTAFEAEPLAEGRPCVFADVVGLWKGQMVAAGETGVEDHYALAPHDYLRFRADGSMMYFGTNTARTDVAAINARLDELDRLDGVAYRAEVPSPGVLLLMRDGAPFQGFTCTVAEPRNGKAVLIWSQLKGLPRLLRVQTRLD